MIEQLNVIVSLTYNMIIHMVITHVRILSIIGRLDTESAMCKFITLAKYAHGFSSRQRLQNPEDYG